MNKWGVYQSEIL